MLLIDFIEECGLNLNLEADQEILESKKAFNSE